MLDSYANDSILNVPFRIDWPLTLVHGVCNIQWDTGFSLGDANALSH